MRFEQSERLRLLPPYLFAEIEEKVAKKKARGETVYDLSIGDPDLPTPPEILEVMCSESAKQHNQGYSSSRGEPFLRDAVAEWYERRFNVELDANKEVCALIGSKEGIANLARAFVNPGDVILVPDPGYPVYANGATILTGGRPRFFELREENEFLPEIGSIDPSGAKLMYLNYPNNPTGAMADFEHLKRLVDFAMDNDILLCYDNAYSEIVFHKEGARSILEVQDAMECCIEVNSCSKTFNMTGSRMAFAAGSADVVSAVAKVKSQIDSGPVPFIQRAAAFALSQYSGRSPPVIVRNNIEIYCKRMKVLVGGLNDIGISCRPSPATFYLWVRVGGSSMDFAMRLLEIGVVVTPGIGFGNAGEGYVRFALTKDADTITKVIETLREADLGSVQNRE